MLDELGGALSFEGSYLSAQNKAMPIFNLPHRETLILLTGYSVPMRAKVIDRWTELEAQVAPKAPAIPATYADALRLAAINPAATPCRPSFVACTG